MRFPAPGRAQPRHHPHSIPWRRALRNTPRGASCNRINKGARVATKGRAPKRGGAGPLGRRVGPT
eukprot:5560506-Alexandrium_andersonii.AAC.1